MRRYLSEYGCFDFPCNLTWSLILQTGYTENVNGTHWSISASKKGMPLPLQRHCQREESTVAYESRSENDCTKSRTNTEAFDFLLPLVLRLDADLHANSNGHSRWRFPISSVWGHLKMASCIRVVVWVRTKETHFDEVANGQCLWAKDTFGIRRDTAFFFMGRRRWDFLQYCRVPKNGLPKNGQAGISPKNKNDPGWKNELRTVHHTQRAFAVKTTSSAALLGLRNYSTSTVWNVSAAFPAQHASSHTVCALYKLTYVTRRRIVK